MFVPSLAFRLKKVVSVVHLYIMNNSIDHFSAANNCWWYLNGFHFNLFLHIINWFAVTKLIDWFSGNSYTISTSPYFSVLWFLKTIPGFYLLAKVEEAADKPIYKWTHQIVSGHTLKHLAAAMVPVFLALMLAKRTVEPERYALYTGVLRTTPLLR